MEPLQPTEQPTAVAAAGSQHKSAGVQTYRWQHKTNGDPPSCRHVCRHTCRSGRLYSRSPIVTHQVADRSAKTHLEQNN